MTKKTKVWAHRGASGFDTQYAPENTMPAFEKAVQMGADGIETDVQLSRDGVVMICHDEKIDRTSDGSGYLKDYTLKELKQFSFSKPHPEYGRVEIPTLEELLAFLKDTNITLNIELKTGLIYYDDLEKKTLDLVRRYGMDERVIYSSFNHYSLQKLRIIYPDVKIGLLISDDYISVDDIRTLGANAIHPAAGISQNRRIRKWHDAGCDVNVWTVDRKVEMLRLSTLGADAIITDCPDCARAIVDGDYGAL